MGAHRHIRQVDTVHMQRWGLVMEGQGRIGKGKEAVGKGRQQGEGAELTWFPVILQDGRSGLY